MEEKPPASLFFKTTIRAMKRAKLMPTYAPPQQPDTERFKILPNALKEDGTLNISERSYSKLLEESSFQPKSCQACGTTRTPEWRKGADGTNTLCNRCGLQWAKKNKKTLGKVSFVEPQAKIAEKSLTTHDFFNSPSSANQTDTKQQTVQLEKATDLKTCDSTAKVENRAALSFILN